MKNKKSKLEPRTPPLPKLFFHAESKSYQELRIRMLSHFSLIAGTGIFLFAIVRHLFLEGFFHAISSYVSAMCLLGIWTLYKKKKIVHDTAVKALTIFYLIFSAIVFFLEGGLTGIGPAVGFAIVIVLLMLNKSNAHLRIIIVYSIILLSASLTHLFYPVFPTLDQSTQEELMTFAFCYNSLIPISAFLLAKMLKDYYRLSEQYDDFSEMIHRAEDLIYCTDFKGNIIFINNATQHFFNCEPEQLFGTSYKELIAVDHRITAEKMYEEYFKSKSENHESVILLENQEGKVKWVHQKHRTIYDEDQKFIRGYLTVARDITKQKELEKTLLEEVALRKQIEVQLNKSQEKERTRIARELHDGVGQKLTAVKLALGAINNSKILTGKMNDALSYSLSIVAEVMSEIRDISQNITPSVLTDYGLSDALSRVCSNIENFQHCNVTYEQQGTTAEVSREVETSLYRFAQEALSNASKHASAKNIHCILSYASHEICLSISDDGKGFSVEESKEKGSGIGNMNTRAKLINASLKIESKPDEGTQIVLTYPLDSKKDFASKSINGN